MLKRLFDIILSLLGLILTSPLLGLVALILKLTSRGPIFYTGERVGKGEKTFKILKFRTMVPDAEKLGGGVTTNKDPRLTKIGRFLRKSKLDELPQLLNILKGDMSFVGPRPEIKRYVELIPPECRSIIYSIRPGLTDLATLYSREVETLEKSPNPEKTYLEQLLPLKIKLQIEYVKTHSFLGDIKLIFKTIFRMFFDRNSPI